MLLHGTSANYAVWQPVQEALQSMATTIALDQRGHGRSDKPSAGYTGREFAQDVINVLDELGIDKATLVGHSMGARNAWLTAAWFPQRVTNVVSVDYTPYVEKDALDELEVRVAGGDRTFSEFSEIERYLQDRYPNMPADAVQRRASKGYARQDDEGWKPLASPKALQQLVEGLRTPWDKEFADVRHTMTHIRGAKSKIVSSIAWTRAKQSRPQDRWVTVEHADHYVPEVAPQVVIDEIQRMLDPSVNEGMSNGSF